VTSVSDLFDAVDPLPDAAARDRYGHLVGLDEVKERLLKESELLLVPAALKAWSERCHDGQIAAVRAFAERRPLFLFAGDVGTGKTELAETFGDAVSRANDIDVMLFRLSLAARGSGAVGEMTKLISDAFGAVEDEIPVPDGPPQIAGVLLIDEADALAQSRAEAQMHHEDRAGVNALIRRIDRVSSQRRPVLTVLCTNRLDAIDPAVRRRAADEFEFERPDLAQREAVFSASFAGSGIGPAEITEIARQTGDEGGRGYGYTYSDLRMRLIPAAILAAYPDSPLSAKLVLDQVASHPPTQPFGQAGTGA
jgi:SpoVK/Ycf46/Vps4 family AAA+-type ATPase